MRMVVNETRRHGSAVRVDGAGGGTVKAADAGDFAVVDANVAAEGRHAGAVDDQPVPDQQVICHWLALPVDAGPRSRDPVALCRECGRALTRVNLGPEQFLSEEVTTWRAGQAVAATAVVALACCVRACASVMRAMSVMRCCCWMSCAALVCAGGAPFQWPFIRPSSFCALL